MGNGVLVREHTCAREGTCVNMCTCVHMFVCGHKHACMHASTHVWVHACMHACMHAGAHVCDYILLCSCAHATVPNLRAHICSGLFKLRVSHAGVGGFVSVFWAACVHACMRARMCECMGTHRYVARKIYTWTYMYTRICNRC